MIDVVPAVLPESFDDLAAKAVQVKDLVQRVQIDIADGSYAPSHTWPFDDDARFRGLATEEEGLPFWEDIEYEVDMLIKNPERVLDGWIAAGVSAAIVHLGTTDDIAGVSGKLRERGVACGLGLLPSTPLEKLHENVTHADFIQHMGSDDIGRHGVTLDERVYKRVREIRERYPNMPIAVDIGVNEETAPLLVEAGATKLVSGSVIFGSENVRETVAYLQNLS